MKYLYLDNFRGFKDTLIPLKDVNFLVGENSTGKTSVLSILKIISSPTFWFRGGFNTDEIKLGNFEDLASNNANQNSSLSLGYMDTKLGKDNKSISTFLISFINDDGVPSIEKITYIPLTFQTLQ